MMSKPFFVIHKLCCFADIATTQLNSTKSWVGLIFLRNHKTTPKPSVTFSHLLHNQTRPNSVCNQFKKKIQSHWPKWIWGFRSMSGQFEAFWTKTSKNVGQGAWIFFKIIALDSADKNLLFQDYFCFQTILSMKLTHPSAPCPRVVKKSVHQSQGASWQLQQRRGEIIYEETPEEKTWGSTWQLQGQGGWQLQGLPYPAGWRGGQH